MYCCWKIPLPLVKCKYLNQAEGKISTLKTTCSKNVLEHITVDCLNALLTNPWVFAMIMGIETSLGPQSLDSLKVQTGKPPTLTTNMFINNWAVTSVCVSPRLLDGARSATNPLSLWSVEVAAWEVVQEVVQEVVWEVVWEAAQEVAQEAEQEQLWSSTAPC